MPRLARHFYGVPTGIRTPVTAVKGRCPRPLDDGDEAFQNDPKNGVRLEFLDSFALQPAENRV